MKLCVKCHKRPTTNSYVKWCSICRKEWERYSGSKQMKTIKGRLKVSEYRVYLYYKEFRSTVLRRMGYNGYPDFYNPVTKRFIEVKTAGGAFTVLQVGHFLNLLKQGKKIDVIFDSGKNMVFYSLNEKFLLKKRGSINHGKINRHIINNKKLRFYRKILRRLERKVCNMFYGVKLSDLVLSERKKKTGAIREMNKIRHKISILSTKVRH